MFDKLNRIWKTVGTMKDVAESKKEEKRMATIVKMQETSPFDQFEDATPQEHEDPFKS